MSKNSEKTCKRKIGVARLAPMYFIENSYDEKGLSAQFLKGFFKLMVEKYDIKVCTELNAEDEKILNNVSLLKKNPFIEQLEYEPTTDSNGLDSIFIFPNESNDYQEEYLENVFKLLDGYEGTVYYMQYNDVLFPNLERLDLEKINFVVLANTNENAGFIYNEDMYGEVDIDGYSLDLNSLIYNNRTTRDKQYYISISLMSDKFKDSYSKLAVKHNNIYFIGNMKDNEYYIGFEYDDFKGYQNLVYKFKHTTMIYMDNIYKYLYNPYFVEAANYTLPIMIDENLRISEDFKVDFIKWDSSKDKYKEFILHKSNSKLLKQLRAIISAKYKEEDLSKELDKILERGF